MSKIFLCPGCGTLSNKIESGKEVLSEKLVIHKCKECGHNIGIEYIFADTKIDDEGDKS